MKDKIIQKLNNYLRKNTVMHTTLWYPLVEIKSGISAAAYYITDIYKDNQINLIERVFYKCGIRTVNTIQPEFYEYHENVDIYDMLYEKDEYGYDFPYLSEMFIWDFFEEWLIYISHEQTISFTGKKISETAKDIIPEKYLIDYE